MKIRLLKKKEIRQASVIVGLNYNKKYKKSSTLELKDMFGNGAVKPVYFVAEEKGKIIGFAGFIQSWMDYNIYQIFWVNVLPELQRKGIGKKLVMKVINEIRKKKDARLILLTTNYPKYYKDHWNFRTIEMFGENKYNLMCTKIRFS
jgi:GNAT superfamily N-acetyltransferase